MLSLASKQLRRLPISLSSRLYPSVPQSTSLRHGIPTSCITASISSLVQSWVSLAHGLASAGITFQSAEVEAGHGRLEALIDLFAEGLGL